MGHEKLDRGECTKDHYSTREAIAVQTDARSTKEQAYLHAAVSSSPNQVAGWCHAAWHLA